MHIIATVQARCVSAGTTSWLESGTSAVIRNVLALFCDTCGWVEYTLDVPREIDAIMKDFLVGRLLARPWRLGNSCLGDIGRDQLNENCLYTENSPPERGWG